MGLILGVLGFAVIVVVVVKVAKGFFWLLWKFLVALVEGALICAAAAAAVSYGLLVSAGHARRVWLRWRQRRQIGETHDG